MDSLHIDYIHWLDLCTENFIGLKHLFTHCAIDKLFGKL